MLAPIQVLQNKFIPSCLFLPKSTNINYLFHKFNVLKINIKFTYAKFMFKYMHNMLPEIFSDYFQWTNQIYNYNTCHIKKLICFYQL